MLFWGSVGSVILMLQLSECSACCQACAPGCCGCRSMQQLAHTSFRLLSLEVRRGQLRMAASTLWGAGDEKNTCALAYRGLPLKSSIRRPTLSLEGVMKYTPAILGRGSRLTATFSTTAPALSFAHSYRVREDTVVQR